MKAKERAKLLWDILIEAAGEPRTIDYTEAAQKIGFTRGRALVGRNGVLGRVSWYCERHGYPDLAAIAVNKRTQRPGREYPDWESLRDEVFAHNWENTRAPMEIELIPYRGTEMYGGT
jgi:hypothetical protein